MVESNRKKRLARQEIVFQVVLTLLVFVFFSLDRNHPTINQEKLVYFLNYLVAALFINYFLLPHFFYRKKYWSFFTGALIVVLITMGIEEMILEAIYYPDTRAKRFPGLLFTLSQILPVIIILSGFKFAWDALTKQAEVEELQSAIKESELQFLKSQINPHFLFNNLNNLYAYALENSPKTPEIILELSGVLRYMLYECREEVVPLHTEIQQLENYIRLNEMQIEERGQVIWEMETPTANFTIAPLILIVFVENAFKHSTASLAADIKIEVTVAVSEKGECHFTCRNNYHRQSNTQDLSQGIGLENVCKRLDLLYPDRHTINFKDNGTIYEVTLDMQLDRQQP